MKTIQNPSGIKLSLILTPLVFVWFYDLFTMKIVPWSIVVGLISIVAFLVPFTYYCVKQKCYAQMIGAYMAIIMFVIFFCVFGWIITSKI